MHEFYIIAILILDWRNRLVIVLLNMEISRSQNDLFLINLELGIFC
jgi:hypothetical protein